MNTSREHLDKLRELLDADPLSPSASPDVDITGTPDGEVSASDHLTDDALNQALGNLGLDALSPEAQHIFLALTDDAASMEPETRRRLVKAAERGIQRRRDETSALPRLLFLERRNAHRDLADIAGDVGVAEDTLREVEQGRRIVESLTPEQLVAWIGTLHVESRRVGESLRRAIAFESGHPRAAAAASEPMPATAQDFIEAVLKLLDTQTPDGPTGA